MVWTHSHIGIVVASLFAVVLAFYMAGFVDGKLVRAWVVVKLLVAAARLIQLELATPGTVSPVWAIALLIIGINGIIAMLLPYAAESYPLGIRGRATGWVAACTKGGGLIAQLLSLLGLVPALFIAALLILIPVVVSLGLVWRYCIETRGRDLRDLESGEALGQPY